MKKLVFLIAVILTGTVVSSFSPSTAAKLYPELEVFFESIEKQPFDQARMGTLESIKDNVNISNLGYTDWNIIFYCSENAFRSQASQVFLQTLCFARKHKKINAFSAGKSATAVSPKLISYLSGIGYRISNTEHNGQAAYAVKFSDDADAILLFSKLVTDQSLPSMDVTSVVVCDSQKEQDCKGMSTVSSSPFELPFEKVNEADAYDKADKVLKEIATEMLYVTKKK